jgi:flavin-binding protein dodecin
LIFLQDRDKSSVNDVIDGGMSPLQGDDVAESVYKVIELIGTSTESWEKAAAAALKRAGKTVRELRVAEVSQLDVQIRDGKIETYRAKVKVSFKYEPGEKD